MGSNPTLSAISSSKDEPGLQQHQPLIGILLHDWSLGGTERVAIRLANAWSRRGCRVVVYVGDAAGMQREMVDPAVGIEVADPDVVSKSWPDFWSALDSLPQQSK